MPNIRPMTLTDSKEVYDIEKLIAISPWSERLFMDCVSVGYQCWIIEQDEQIIGYAILSYVLDEAHLLNIAIAPPYQQSGFGAKLLEHIINIAKKCNCNKVFLEVRKSNTIAQKFYDKHNFVQVGTRKDYYPDGNNGEPKEDALVMVNQLEN